MLVISPTARISPLADIEDSTIGTRIEILDGVMIDAFVKIKVAGGRGDLFIGRNCYINSGTVLYTGNGIRMGENVLVAANCTFAPTNHEFRSRDIPIVRQGFQQSRGGIVVEDDVWIAANTVVLDGAVLRQGSVVGANSVVRGELEPYSINVGSPTRLIGFRT